MIFWGKPAIPRARHSQGPPFPVRVRVRVRVRVLVRVRVRVSGRPWEWRALTDILHHYRLAQGKYEI